MDITGQLHHIGIILNQDTFIASLEEMTFFKVSGVEFSGISGAEPLHCLF
jgi:hypothetical protein